MQHITEPTFSQLLVYATPSVAPEGILILLHGCNHGGLDWENLPVEKTIVSAVLSHGLVAVAPTSVDRDSRCWSEDDIDRVKAAITFIRSHLSLPNARVFLLGASSGGSFALRFARLAKGVSAICMQISYGRRGLIGYNTPTLLVHMPRDNRSADVINKQIQTFRAEGIPADEFKCEPKSLSGGDVHAFFLSHVYTYYTCYKRMILRLNVHAGNISATYMFSTSLPLHLTQIRYYHITHMQNLPYHLLLIYAGEFFYRSGALSEEDSKVLTNALVEFGYLNARGHLLANPRESDWRKVLSTHLMHTYSY